MRDIRKFFGIITAMVIIGFTFTACGDSGNGGNNVSVQRTEGRLIISGLDDFDDRYRIFVFGSYYNPITSDDFSFFAGQGITGSVNNPTNRGVVIDYSMVTLYLWEMPLYHPGLLAFEGNVVPNFGTALIVRRDISWVAMEDIWDFIDEGFTSTAPSFLRAVGYIDIDSTTARSNSVILSGTFNITYPSP